MPPVDAPGHSPKFRLWLRRNVSGEAAYALRFEVQEGKGILRVSRPGVLIDPPARPMGLEERLTAPQLKTTRFILVWDGGRARQGHLLSRLEESALQTIESDRWHEMEVLVEGGFRYVIVPIAAIIPVPPKAEKTRRPSLSELRHELDSLTLRNEEDEDPDSALASLTGPSPVNPKSKKKAPREATELPKPVGELRSTTPAVAVPPTHEVGRKTKGAARPALSAVVTNYSESADGDETLALGEADGDDDSAFDLALGEAEPGVEADAALALGEAEPGVEADAALALGEAEPGVEADAALALGEAEPGVEADAALALGEAEPGVEADDLLLSDPDSVESGSTPENLLGSADATEVPEPSRRPAPKATLAGATTGHDFLDDDEEAAFSIDLPSFRKPTDHVNVMRPSDDNVTAVPGNFIRKPISVESLDAGPDEDLDLGEDEPRGTEASTAPSGTREQAAHEPPWARLPSRDLVNSPTLSDEGDDDGTPPGHRSPTTLVRHLRRQVEEQRARIAQLESRIAELEAGLAPRKRHG